MAIDFTLTAEQKALQKVAREFARNVLEPLVPHAERQRDPQARFAAMLPAYEQAYALGLAFGFLPRQYGGAGGTNLNAQIISEELCAVDAGFSSILGVNALACMPILWYGTEAQKQQWLTAAANDPTRRFVASWCASEPEGTANLDGPDAYPAGIRTTAEWRDGEWVINGRKFWVSNAAGWDMLGADLSVVLCRVDRNQGARGGLACMLVPRGTPGMRFEEIIDKMGLLTAQNVLVVYNNVRIPEANAFAVGDADLAVARAWGWTGAGVGIKAVAIARRAYEYVLDWARTFTAGGSHPILGRPNVGYMLADIAMRIEASRYLCWKAAHYGDTHDNQVHTLGSMAKIFATETCTQVVYDCMRVMGMNSYDRRNHPVMDKCMRDILCFPLYDGGNMGMRRRAVWGAMVHPSFDPDAIRNCHAMPFTRDMEGLGT